MINDPICGMSVDKNSAQKRELVSIKAGVKYYFCSKTCKQKFDAQKTDKTEQGKTQFRSYIPALLVVTLLFFSAASYFYGFMPQFMGIFFIIVAILKMLDWQGFADSYRNYDLIAKKSRTYALLYPLIELALGILFVFELFTIQAAVTTIIVMSVGTIGVAKNLLSKNPVQCACLGTHINVPLTKFTLVEDVLMIIMGIMILVM